ncbi:MAG: GNAT family N-acetyltransferase [Kibdelosporangium sp.]
MTNGDEAATMEYVTDLMEDNALRAAMAAGVTVRELAGLDELDAVYRLYNDIWRPDPSNPPVTTELLRAMTKAGNYVSGAFEADRLVGACVAFFGAPTQASMHSHVAGVSSVGRSVGFALKLHQREWAIRRGVSAISWTFDPLISRNAYFNVVKLAAMPVEYLPNFYGGMRDGINGSDDSDRLLVRWDLDSPQVVAACAGKAEWISTPGDAVFGLAQSDRGSPVAGSLAGPTVLVAVPRDIQALRAADPRSAREWRVAVRDVLGALLADGARVSGFDKSGWYIVTREDGA